MKYTPLFFLVILMLGCSQVQAQAPDIYEDCDKIEDSLAWLICTAKAEVTATAAALPDVPVPTGVRATTGLYPPHILVEWDTPPDTAQEIYVRAEYPPPRPGHGIEGGEMKSKLLRVKPSQFSYVRPCDVSDSHIRIINRCFGSSTFNRFALYPGRVYGITVTFGIKDKGRESAEIVWARIPLDAPTHTPIPSPTWTPLPYWANTPGFWSPTPTPVPPGWDTPTPEPTAYYGTVIPTLTPAPWQFTHWTPTPTRESYPTFTPYPTNTPYPSITPYPTRTPYPTAVPNRDRESLERQVADLQARVDLLERKLADLERYLGVTWSE